jgi:hypothetical protein
MDIIDTTISRLILLSLLILTGCSTANNGNLSSQPPSSPETTRTVETPTTANDDAARPGKVIVSYSLSPNHVTLHEPIILNFSVINRSSEKINLDLGFAHEESFLFTLKLPNGTSVQLPQHKWPDAGGASINPRFPIEPGKAYSQKLFLNAWYEFAEPGKYEIAVRLAVPIVNEQGASVEGTNEFRIALEIAPRDPERLRQICADLAAQVIQAGGSGVGQEPTKALAYIRDPVAIPYLEAALTPGPWLNSSAVYALAKIGGNESADILIRAMNTQSRKEERELVRIALDKLREASSDPLLKEKIEKALAN